MSTGRVPERGGKIEGQDHGPSPPTPGCVDGHDAGADRAGEAPGGGRERVSAAPTEVVASLARRSSWAGICNVLSANRVLFWQVIGKSDLSKRKMLYKIAVACMIAAIGAAPVPEVNPAALQNAATAIQQNPTLVNSAAAELQKNADMQAAVAKAAESLHQANTKAPEPTKAPESVAEPADAPQTAAQLAQKFQKPASMDIHLYGKLRKIVEDAIDYEFKVRKLTTPSADTVSALARRAVDRTMRNAK